MKNNKGIIGIDVVLFALGASFLFGGVNYANIRKQAGNPIVVSKIQPPLEVPANIGFNFQRNESLQLRAEFFKTHELIDGQWVKI